MQYFIDRAVRSDNTLFIQNKSKFVKAHTTSGHKHAIDEIFLDPAVSGKLGEVKAVQEVGYSSYATAGLEVNVIPLFAIRFELWNGSTSCSGMTQTASVTDTTRLAPFVSSYRMIHCT